MCRGRLLRASARIPGGSRVGVGAGDLGGAQDRGVFSAVATARDGDDLGVVEKSIEDGAGSGTNAEEFAPFLQGAVAGRDRGTVFVPAHDDFQEILPGVFGKGLKALLSAPSGATTLQSAPTD